LGGFDERFFLYFEETDLQLNLLRKGYKNCIYNDTKIIHLEGASSGGGKEISNRQRIIFQTSRVHYMQKNFYNQYLLFKLLDKIVLYFQILDKTYTRNENLLLMFRTSL
jgi:GT2 family glycosyltransferase